MIVNNTHILTLPLYTTTSPNAILTFTCILIGHTYTDATVYTISNLPYSHIPLHGPSLTKSVPNALTSLCTALASAVYTLCHSTLPIPTTIHHNRYPPITHIQLHHLPCHYPTISHLLLTILLFYPPYETLTNDRK